MAAGGRLTGRSRPAPRDERFRFVGRMTRRSLGGTAWRPGGEERRESGEEVVEAPAPSGRDEDAEGLHMVLEASAEASASSGEDQQGGFEVVDVGQGELQPGRSGRHDDDEVPAPPVAAVLPQATVGVGGLADVDGIAA